MEDLLDLLSPRVSLGSRARISLLSNGGLDFGVHSRTLDCDQIDAASDYMHTLWLTSGWVGIVAI